MKKENQSRRKPKEGAAQNNLKRQPEIKENKAETIQKEAAAKQKEEKKKRTILTCIRIGAVAAVALLLIAAVNFGRRKPDEPAAAMETTAEQSEQPKSEKPEQDTKRTAADSRKEVTKEPEKEQPDNTKEQTDGRKADEDSKKTAGEKDKNREETKTEDRNVYKEPDERKKGPEDTLPEEPSGDSETTEPSPGTQDQENAQEESVRRPSESVKPEAPQQPQEDVYPPSDPVVTPEPHSHTWQEKYRTVHHDAVTEEVKVVDQPAYTEPVYEEQPVYETISVYICDVCGEEFESVGEHSQTHIDWETFTNPFHYHVDFRQGGQIGTELVQTGSINHPEESHMETRVVKEAYDEQIPDGYVCTGCGAVQ